MASNLTIIHGDNVTQSRLKLTEIIAAIKPDHSHIKLEAKKITRAILEEAFGSTSLFDPKKLIVIEHLHSLPRSKRKTELIEFIADNAQVNPNNSIILWEKRSLTATMLKKLSAFQAIEFKTSKTMFKWLDSLNGTSKNKTRTLELFHQTIASDGDFMCLSMLMRQVRLLIQAKEGAPLSGAPFMIAKLKKQALTFSLHQLISLHQFLFEIDSKQKSSQLPLGLEKSLDLLLINL